LDRFALSVEIRGIQDARERVLIMQHNLGFETEPEAFRQKWLSREQELSHQIEHARTLVDDVTYSNRDLLSIAGLTSSLNVDGHRADLVILKTARAHAAFEGRTEISDRDIVLAAELALPHRIKRGPFHQAEISMDDFQERIEELHGGASAGEGEPEPAPQEGEGGEKKKP
jgi:Mg-chelatase subunit ChlI